MTNNMVSRGNYSFGETKLLHNMFIHTTKVKKYE
jgi:hypothetical protein